MRIRLLFIGLLAAFLIGCKGQNDTAEHPSGQNDTAEHPSHPSEVESSDSQSESDQEHHDAIDDPCTMPTHAYSQTNWESDATHHWHVCVYCGQKLLVAPHDFDPETNRCRVCDHYGPHEHLSDGTVYHDESYHWETCELCGEAFGEESHKWASDPEGFLYCEHCPELDATGARDIECGGEWHFQAVPPAGTHLRWVVSLFAGHTYTWSTDSMTLENDAVVHRFDYENKEWTVDSVIYNGNTPVYESPITGTCILVTTVKTAQGGATFHYDFAASSEHDHDDFGRCVCGDYLGTVLAAGGTWSDPFNLNADHPQAYFCVEKPNAMTGFMKLGVQGGGSWLEDQASIERPDGTIVTEKTWIQSDWTLKCAGCQQQGMYYIAIDYSGSPEDAMTNAAVMVRFTGS